MQDKFPMVRIRWFNTTNMQPGWIPRGDPQIGAWMTEPPIEHTSVAYLLANCKTHVVIGQSITEDQFQCVAKVPRTGIQSMEYLSPDGEIHETGNPPPTAVRPQRPHDIDPHIPIVIVDPVTGAPVR